VNDLLAKFFTPICRCSLRAYIKRSVTDRQKLCLIAKGQLYEWQSESSNEMYAIHFLPSSDITMLTPFIVPTAWFLAKARVRPCGEAD
jgi:hypothetical protein